MNTDVIKFGEMLKTDPDLQKQVSAATASHLGDVSTEDAYNILKPFAEERDVHVTFEEFKDYLDNLQKPNSELSDDELDQVSGGKGWCALIGGSNVDGLETNCSGSGKGHDCQKIGWTFG